MRKVGVVFLRLFSRRASHSICCALSNFQHFLDQSLDLIITISVLILGPHLWPMDSDNDATIFPTKVAFFGFICANLTIFQLLDTSSYFDYSISNLLLWLHQSFTRQILAFKPIDFAALLIRGLMYDDLTQFALF